MRRHGTFSHPSWSRGERARQTRLLGRLALLATVAFGAGCASSGSAGVTPSVTIPRNPIIAFQEKEDRLFQIGYRLAEANAPFCDRRDMAIGLLLHDMRAYSDPEIIRSALSLHGDIGVQSVARGSPADEAGLRQNDTLLAIDGESFGDAPHESARNWERAAAIARTIAHSATDGSVHLTWRSADGQIREKALGTVLRCASTFELVSGNKRAAADGERVLVGDAFPGFAYSDGELAAVLAHEMAHNLLGHIPLIAREGRGGGRGRSMERDADRMMPWLLANAGFDARSAATMMAKYGPAHGGGLLRRRTHDGWDERVDLIEREIENMQALQQASGDEKANWQEHFEPELRAERTQHQR